MPIKSTDSVMTRSTAARPSDGPAGRGSVRKYLTDNTTVKTANTSEILYAPQTSNTEKNAARQNDIDAYPSSAFLLLPSHR